MPVVEFKHVDIVFGGDRKTALGLLSQGVSRDEVIARTRAVAGAIDISFAVERGEICVLMGLSGSGKSTVLRAINRLNEVARGSVAVEHRGAVVDVTTCNAATLRDLRMHTVAMVFQQFALLPWRTVRENVGFGLELRGDTVAERGRIVDEKLALVGLTGWGDKYSHELSGGMQQRVGLARAFATDAEILLMDEPFSALDPLIRDKLQDELLDLQRKLKKTIVFVSHDLDEALKLGNSIAILESGRIVQMGTAEDILLRPADAYVAEFVKHMNPLNVLRGTSVITPASALKREDGAVVIDTGSIRVRIDADDRPVVGIDAHADRAGIDDHGAILALQRRGRCNHRGAAQDVQRIHMLDELGDVGVRRPEQDVLGGAHLHDASALQDGDGVAELQRLVEIVTDEDDRLLQFALQVEQLVLQLVANERVEGRERFVHQKDLGVGGEGAGKTDPLLHAARKFVRILVAPAGQADQRQLFVDAAAALRHRVAAQFETEADVLAHSPPRQQRELLEDHGDGVHA